MATLEEREELREIAELLGGKRVLRQEITEPDEMRAAVRKGFPFRAVEFLMRSVAIQLREISALIGVPARTLARRKEANQLNALESDRLYRIAHVIGLARLALGSLDKTKEWLQRSNRAFGGAAPISLLDTDIGVRQVEEVLNRINYGIYS